MQLCDQILIHGVCHLDGCTARHDVHSCTLCRVYYASAAELERHNTDRRHLKRTEQHRKKLAGLSKPVRCTICPVNLSNVTLYEQHARGRRHRLALEQQGLDDHDDPGPEELEVPPHTNHCEICDTNIPLIYWQKHLKGLRHSQAQGFVVLESALEEAERDKNGIVVSEGPDFGLLEWTDTVVEHDTKLSVQNNNTTTVVLTDARITSHYKVRASLSHFYLPLYVKGLRISSGAKTNIAITFGPRNVRGRFQDRIELHFEDLVLKKRFAITRPLNATVGVKADYEALRPKAPYVRPKLKTEEPISDPIPGIAPPALAAIVWKVALPKFPIPPGLKELAFGNGTYKELAKKVRNAFLPRDFDCDTYGRHLKVMIWIEEEQARRDLQLYNLSGTTLTRSGVHYNLTVDGLAEKRPSIIVGDKIYVKNYGSSSERWFEGHVHRVYEKSVDLRFHDSFNSYKGQKYDVRFDLNRLTLRRMHQALSSAFTRPEVLFPDQSHVVSLRAPTASRMDDIRCVDRKVGDNKPQLAAVTAIVHRPAGSVPFVIFGPPGTGKTVTMVEAIRQVLYSNPNARILACAPSNSASDIIAERLTDLGKSQIFRLIAPSRSPTVVPQAVKNIAMLNSDGVFSVPPVAQLQKFRVVVSTCFSASVPHGIGVPRGHFTHIFIDEAGQAQEPEVMIPIKTMADNNTNVILSGDCKQLGPIVRSGVARELGLAKSYLDRLMENPIYDQDRGYAKTIVKLTKNWRSHPSILKFPNDEFYKGELEACGDPLVTRSLLRWDELPTPNFPIIFHGISGKDMREASSPSFFNIDEASLVKTYVQKLFDDRRLRLTPQHIGIISPYNAQVAKIRGILPGKAKEIKVGSVEEFQGQERRVIIISTVRSSVDFVKYDLRHTLGFVANQRRFNVAVTRAQALLIVIGDPLVLSLDPLWKSFINHVHIHGGYIGKKIDWDPTEAVDRSARYDEQRRRTDLDAMEELIERTKSLVIGQSEDLAERDDDDELEGNVDKPWREDE
ncbi:P-loop containing nucleoside triphosphate hydrolase protein [Rickenella mellea]|uniref:RNA helicase n=1 Tax=Rickenella mellea TaxID=50990 RepID=A0A4Y7QAH7_9AGAM|nr:P-loop containing nucleoside triphosphate hydrolase protein [Rickenella mellea]